jgi:diguanylate cyclase (GGDEF)-like protein
VIVPNGEPRWFRREFHPYFDESGNVVRIDGIMEDTTEAKQALKHMEHLANTDVLTGLANRTLWYDRLTQAIAGAERNNTQVVLMLLDLNHFKMVNDTLGHPVGDAILKKVAKRMAKVLRESDTLARLGGDEFGVLLSGVEDPEKSSTHVAGKILDCMRKPFYLENHDEIYLGASIGIALYPDHGEDADTLLSHADIAMYAAKRGDSDFTFYDPDSDESASSQLKLSAWLRHSMDRNELDIHYQPKVDMDNGHVCGMEALLRWNHPEKGVISPTQFIPVAEQNGMITPITDWVLLSALKQAGTWRESGLASRVAVNISARSFQNPKLVQRIKTAINEANVEGDCLEIEITENVLMTDLERGSDITAQLNDLGVKISIDDFGTGYSSLSYLKRLPIHTVKIDKSFVMDMIDSDNDAVIVRSIIDLGHRLGLEVIAEGVENQMTWDLLKEWGCNSVQGYHVSRPQNSNIISDWLTKNTCH